MLTQTTALIALLAGASQALAAPAQLVLTADSARSNSSIENKIDPLRRELH